MANGLTSWVEADWPVKKGLSLQGTSSIMRIEVNIVNISFLILQYLFFNGNIRKSAVTGNVPLRFKAELSFICTAKGKPYLIYIISKTQCALWLIKSLGTNIREDPAHEIVGRRFWPRKKRLKLLFVLPDEFYGPLSHWCRVMTFPPSSKTLSLDLSGSSMLFFTGRPYERIK